jgi:hypothetical protein
VWLETTMDLIAFLLVLGSKLVNSYDTNNLLQSISSSLQSSEAPIIDKFSFPSNIRLGKRTTVVCSVVSGSEPLTFQWFKDQKLVRSTSDVDIAGTRSSSILSLSPVSSSHAGNWTCQVKNDFGLSSHTASLDVERE